MADTPPQGSGDPEVYVGSPSPTNDPGTPVTYSPPGMETYADTPYPYQEPPVLPRAVGAWPIGGPQNVFKAVSHYYIFMCICIFC